MAETTETDEAGTRRPLKIAAPLLGFLGAVVGAVLGATVLHAVFRNDEPAGAYAAGISVGGLYVLLCGPSIARPGHASGEGRRRAALLSAVLAGFGVVQFGWIPDTLSFLVAFMVSCVAVIAGGLAGVRIGSVMDRRGEITGESVDTYEPS